MKFLNLTPHVINVYKEMVDVHGESTGLHEETLVIPASGSVSRVDIKPVYCFGIATDGVDFYRQVVGDVIGLPNPQDDVMLIVSAQVRLALPNRKDLVSPGELKRNDAGQPIGCVGFYIN